MSAADADEPKAAPASQAQAVKAAAAPEPPTASASSRGWCGAVTRSALPAAALASVILVVAYAPFGGQTASGLPIGRGAGWDDDWEGGPADWAATERRLQVAGQCAEQIIPMPSASDAMALQCATCGVPFVEPNTSCRYNTSQCLGVQPGGACNITCAAPYVGNGTIVGTCPEGNSNFGRLLRLNEPIANMVCGCPQPEGVAGYVQDMNGKWLCAEGYAGKASVMCGCDSNSSWLEGCALRVPCAAPSVDLCRYDVSSCVSVEPGATCEVRCRPPFIGGPTVATCNISNTDPLKELDYFPLRCILESCVEPNPLPAGYNKSADGRSWTCATGYSGTALAQCAPGGNWSSDCSATMQLSGCLPIVQCGAPALSGMDACVYDVSGCQNVADGGMCEVHCKAPFIGISKEANCPAANTDPNGLVWERPQCSLTQCKNPDVTPRGYALLTTGWACDFAYSGFAVKECTALPSCEIVPVLSGCVQPLPCEAPTAHCKYDTSYCQSVQPGEECRIGCKEPYSGGEVTARCPQGNTVTDGLVVNGWPTCITAGCADPYPAPDGYRRRAPSDWVCADGYNGTVVKSCIEPADGSCEAVPELSGCRREQTCQPLEIPEADLCRFNTTGCTTLQPGEVCTVRCKEPYSGRDGSVSCPVGNTNATTKLTMDLPDCDCEDPISIPPGYLRSNTTGEWSCAPGYAGTAVKLCLPGAGCTAEPSLSGCMAPVVCEAGEFMDEGSGQGVVYGDISFGPALILGKINEEMVAGYSIYFGDECNMSIGEELAFVRKEAEGQPCCRNDTYKARLMGDVAPKGTRGFVIKAWLKPSMEATTTTSAAPDPDGTLYNPNEEAPVGLFVPLKPEYIKKRVMTGAASRRLPAAAALALVALAATFPGGSAR